MTHPHLSRPAFFGSLESLRGLAALLVVFYHMPETHFPAGIVRNSYLMVDLFFVLSGFVLAHSYRDKIRAGMDMREFTLLRLGRLYPLHLAILLAFLSVDAFTQFSMKTVTATVGPLREYRADYVLTNLLLVQGWNLTERIAINRPSWSIGCEFYTYLVFALVTSKARTERAFLAACGGLVVLSAAFLAVWAPATLDVTSRYGQVRCLLGFFCGVIAYQARRNWAPPRWLPIAIAALLVLFVHLKTRGWTDYGIIPLAAVLIAALAQSPEGRLTRLLEAKPLAWLGKVSYSVYMVHYLIIVIAFNRIGRMWRPLRQVTHPPEAAGAFEITVHYLYCAAVVAAVLVVSAITYRWIEDPFRRRARDLAKRWFNRPASARV